MSELMKKLKKNTSFNDGRVNLLSDSPFLHQKDNVPTNIPAMNVAFSGSLDNGYTSGLTMIAGPSKHFKTAFGLIMMKSYLDKYPDQLHYSMIVNLVHHRIILMYLKLILLELYIFQLLI